MNISPLEVYLLFNIGSFIKMFAILCVTFVLVVVIALLYNTECSKKEEEIKTSTITKWSVASLLCFIMTVILPTKETIAAMYIIPLLTSDKAISKYEKAGEVMSDETKEILSLTKDAIKSIIHKEEEKK